jgi:hypothetical protein
VKGMAELAGELEDLLRRMSREQLRQIVDCPPLEDPDVTAVAKRLAKTELARRQLH